MIHFYSNKQPELVQFLLLGYIMNKENDLLGYMGILLHHTFPAATWKSNL